MVRVPGVEPGTFRVSVECSSHLSYTRMQEILSDFPCKINLFIVSFTNSTRLEGFDHFVDVPQHKGWDV